MAGVSFPRRLAGVVGLSGWLAFGDQLSERVSDANASLPFLLCHGTIDDKVLFSLGERARDALKKGGHDVTWLEVDGLGHSFHPVEAKALVAFLTARLPKDAPASDGKTSGVAADRVTGGAGASDTTA